jgi:uncharacterized protein YutE (UPF0331/DUF86 family)
MEGKNKINIDDTRLERYIEKLEHFKKLALKLEKWIENVDEEKFVSLDLKEQFAIYHAFQILVEITTDLIAMTVKDLKFKPRDDYSNIKCLKEQNFISEELSERLRRVNGLRNVIVHDYNGIDEILAFKEINENFYFMKKFYDVMKKWLKKNS